MRTAPARLSSRPRAHCALVFLTLAAAACTPPDDEDVGVIRSAGFGPAPPLFKVKPGTHTVHGNVSSCAILQGTPFQGGAPITGSVKCWGANGSGQLGLGDTSQRGDNPNEMGNNLPFVSLGTSRTATALALGREFTCALLDNAQVKCWGANTLGQLGQGDKLQRGSAAGQMGDQLGTVSLGTGRTVKAIGAGFQHACAILDNNTVKCWGGNAAGQLGRGDTASRGDDAGELGDLLPTVALGTGRTAKSLSLGGYSTCVVLDNDTLKCWGINNEGQLGLGDTNARGDQAGEMGDLLPTVALGTGRTVKMVSIDYRKACAILDNNVLKCWGFPTSTGTDGVWYGDNANEMGDLLPAVALGTGRTAVTVVGAGFKTCALLDNATVKCWGAGGVWGLGYGDNASRGNSPGQMGDMLPAINFGSGPSGPYTVTALGGGGATFAPSTQEQFCATLDNGWTRCWGPNFYGQIGLGDTGNPRGDNPNEMGDALPILDLGK